MKILKISLMALSALWLCKPTFAQLRFANLGDYQLENREILKEATIAFKTYGKLNKERNNAIVFTTWYGGTGKSLMPYIGSGTMIDTTQYYLIVIDALGDGVSSSPSNSKLQPNENFPKYSIKDMVDLQHKLVTEVLEINHLYAVTGISMGGMQTYQWMASYSDFFDRAIPIVGSPELSSYDRLTFDTFNKIFEATIQEKSSQNNPAFLMLEYLLGLTPAYRNNETKLEDYLEFIETMEKEAQQYNLFDLHSQMKAIGAFSLKAPLIKSRFKGKALIVLAKKDHLLLPSSAKELATAIDAELLEMDSDCGHYSFSCEIENIGMTVSNFLRKD